MRPQRPESPELETRITPGAVQLRAAGGSSRKIGGRAATFRSPSEDLGGFTERIDPRFFSKSQGDGWPGVMARFQHSDQAILGSVQAGTLRLDIDHAGLNYELDCPESRGDVLELVARGDVAHSSIAFQTWEDDWTTEGGTAIRTLLSGRLVDVAPVSQPAYRSTSVALRSLADYTDAPVADVLTLAAQGELRKLLSRTDRRSDRVPAYPGAGHRWTRRTGAQALIETLGKRWPEEPSQPKSGRLALTELMGKRWGPM